MLGALALLSLPTIAHANIISSHSQGVLSYSGNGSYDRIFFPEFDRSLGTINSVELEISGTYTIEARSSNAMNGTAQFGPTILTVNNQYTVVNLGSHTGTKTEFIASAAPFSFNIDVVLPADVASSNPITRQTVVVLTGTQDYLNNPGQTIGDNSHTTLFNTLITYEYTPFATTVPEPASMALLALGVLGAAKVSRRRSAL